MAQELRPGAIGRAFDQPGMSAITKRWFSTFTTPRFGYSVVNG